MTNWTMQVLAGGTILGVRTSGVFVPAMGEQMSVEALAAGRQHGISRYLIDHRQMHLNFSTFELYDFPETLERIGVPRDYHIALVVGADSTSLADFQFFESVAINRGFSLRLFTDLDAATAWLRSV